MSCKYCKRTIFTRECDYSNGAVVKHYNKEKPNFCFECGEPLVQPEPLTLEQLKQMDGEPVYAVLRAKDEYGMPSCFKDGWYLVIASADSIFIKSNNATILANGDYGVDIKLYTHKPRPQQNGWQSEPRQIPKPHNCTECRKDGVTRACAGGGCRREDCKGGDE